MSTDRPHGKAISGALDDIGGEDATASTSVWNRELLLLLAVAFLAYANISVFFHFYEYLRTLPIDPKWFGLLIGAYSAVSLAVRPVVSPFFHSGNARRFLYVGTVMAMAALSFYGLATGFLSMLLVRCFHGLAFVVMGAALMALMIDHIPKGRSAQVFGLMGIITLLPNTVVPPMLPFLEGLLGGFSRVLLLFAGVTLLVVPFVHGISSPLAKEETSSVRSPLNGKEIREDLGSPTVLLLLGAMLLFYCSQALIFFFLDPFGKNVGIGSTGLFLTLATASEIGVRIAAGSRFDRMDKVRLVAWTMVGLAAACALLGHARSEIYFFSLGTAFGLGWGIAMPVFGSLMFDLSPARFRAFNTNLGMQMFQAGYFLGPFIGGPVVARWGFQNLFLLCALLSLGSSSFAFFLRVVWKGRKRHESQDERIRH